MKKLKPFQNWVLKKMKTKKISSIFMTMGLGKTVVVSQYLKDMNFQYSLIVCPKIIISHWITHLEDILKTDIVIIEAKSSKYIWKYIKKLVTAPDKKDQTIFITNYEFIRARKPLFKDLAKILNSIVLDESNYIQNRKAGVTKAVTGIFRAVQYRTILSGTPFLKIVHIYSQMEFIKYNFWRTNYWGFFMTYVNFIETEVRVHDKIVKFKKIIGPNKRYLPQLLRKLKKEGNAIFTEDVSGYEKLPAQTTMPVDVELDEKLREEYELFKHDMISEIGDIENSIHAGAKLVKLQQVISGVHLKSETNKFKLLTNILENEVDTENTPAVIWCRFRKSMNLLHEKLKKKYKDLKVFRIDGSTPQKDRAEILKYLNENNNCLLIIQVQVGRFGVDLKTTSVGIFYEFDFSLLNFTQCKGRIRRLSSKGSSVNYILYYKNTVDHLIYKALVKGLNDAELVKEVYKSIVKEAEDNNL